MESIDPLKEAKANEVEVDTGVRSRRSIIEGQVRDFDKHVREYQEELKIFPDQNLQRDQFSTSFQNASIG